MPGRQSSRGRLQAFLKSLFRTGDPVSQSSDKTPSNKEGSICFFILKWMAILLILPPVLNFGALLREEREMKAGDTFDIGFRQNVFMNCSGEGLPTVILDAPTGMTSDAWALIMHQLSQHTRVCVYDRPGIGRSDVPKRFNASDPGEGIIAKVAGAPYTSLRMVHDLNRLLTYSFPQKQPFILVGSEIGAINMLMYSKIHEEQVYGLILINPLTNSIFEEANSGDSFGEFRDSTIVPWLQMMQIGAMSGLNRLGVLAGIIKPFKGFEDKFPLDAILREKHHFCNPSSLDGILNEYLNLHLSTQQLETTLSLGMPRKSLKNIIVMRGSYYDEFIPSSINQVWSRSAKEITSKLHDCEHLVIDGANKTMIYTHTNEILSPIKRIIKNYRSKARKVQFAKE